MSHRKSLLGILGLVLLAVTPAAATTIVRVSDSDLVRRSRLVVEGTVEASLPNSTDAAATEWLVSVDRVLKGEIGSSRFVLRVPGGRAADGWELRIAGTPPLGPGVRGIFFLGPEREGKRRIVDFPQGAFVVVGHRGRPVAVRDLSEVRELGSRRRGVREPVRDARRFAEWIARRAQGRPASSRLYLVKDASLSKRDIQPYFNLILRDGRPTRWFEFDGGGSVTWLSHSTGQVGFSGGGVAELQRALAAWNDEAATPVQLVYGGTTDAAGGFEHNDDLSVVHWNDPNDEMEGRFSCGVGGTVGLGGPWTKASDQAVFDGKTFRRIGSADVIINDGIECIRSSAFLQALLTHELGHGLGLGHTSENYPERNARLSQAIMYGYISSFRTRLGVEDVAALQALYLPGGRLGDGTGSGCPHNRLCLMNGRFAVTAEWSNQFDGSSGTAVGVPYTDIAGFFTFGDPSNLELAVKIADFGDRIKVFYTQLTNLRFTLYVTDTVTGKVKTYSNTPGDCGALDDDFLAGMAAASAPGFRSSPHAIVGGKCRSDATTLCLLDDRFAVAVDWRNQFDGSSGTGKPRALSKLTGAFSFGDPNNLELLIKTLDFGDHQLVLYGALSNLEYTIRVTEAASGRTKTYFNPAGKFCGGLDEHF
jgi:hypothetical protein